MLTDTHVVGKHPIHHEKNIQMDTSLIKKQTITTPSDNLTSEGVFLHLHLLLFRFVP